MSDDFEVIRHALDHDVLSISEDGGRSVRYASAMEALERFELLRDAAAYYWLNSQVSTDEGIAARARLREAIWS